MILSAEPFHDFVANDQVLLEVNRKLEYIQSDINMLKDGIFSTSSNGSSNAVSDLEAKMKIIAGEMQNLRMVSRRIELHQATEATSLATMRELYRSMQSFRIENEYHKRVEVELKDQIEMLRADSTMKINELAKQLAERPNQVIYQQGGGGGGGSRRGDLETGDDASVMGSQVEFGNYYAYGNDGDDYSVGTYGGAALTKGN